jgi:Uma2 family endonuclease
MAVAIQERHAPLRMSFDEYIEWMDEDTHAEWVNGEVVFMSPVSDQHATVCFRLARWLEDFIEAHDLGQIYLDPFVMKSAAHLPARQPDILFVRKDHLNRISRSGLSGPADLVIEIISPESRVRDREAKFLEYQQSGVGEYWIIDPEQRVADFYQRSETGLYEAVSPNLDGKYECRAIPGLWVNVNWLWRRPMPTAAEIRKTWGMT